MKNIRENILKIMRKIFFILSLFLCTLKTLTAQESTFEEKMDSIMSEVIEDYPEPTIRALKELYGSYQSIKRSPREEFFYNYNLGGCYSYTDSTDLSLKHLLKSRKIATTNHSIGIRNIYALDSELLLANQYLKKGGQENIATALSLFTDVFTVGIGLLNFSEAYRIVVDSIMAQAKHMSIFGADDNWIQELWLFAREIAIESNNPMVYTNYYIEAAHYYCDRKNYETACTFINDMSNNNLLLIDQKLWINTIDSLLKTNTEIEKINRGAKSDDYWRLRTEEVTATTLVCSPKEAVKRLVELEKDLSENKLKRTFEYASIVYLLSLNTTDKESEPYIREMERGYRECPDIFIYEGPFDIYNRLGVCLMKQGKYDEALVNYNTALQILNHDIEYIEPDIYKTCLYLIYHNLGRVKYFLKHYDESAKILRQSIELQEEVNGKVLPKTTVYLREAQDKMNKN